MTFPVKTLQMNLKTIQIQHVYPSRYETNIEQLTHRDTFLNKNLTHDISEILELNLHYKIQ